MKQPGGQVGLAVEPVPILFVGGQGRRKDFERVVARQSRVGHKVHLAHSPGAQQSLHGVPGKNVTATQRHGRIVQNGTGQPPDRSGLESDAPQKPRAPR
jgi:hypothetical protein